MNSTNSTATEQSESGRAITNRANSQHSTGPRSDAGKKRSSLNALRHGLTSQIIVMPEEDLNAYQRHARTFFDDLKPKGAVEQQLVQSLADTAWRLNRIPALEANVLTLDMHAHTGSIDLEIDKESHHAEVRAALISHPAVPRCASRSWPFAAESDKPAGKRLQAVSAVQHRDEIILHRLACSTLRHYPNQICRRASSIRGDPAEIHTAD